MSDTKERQLLAVLDNGRLVNRIQSQIEAVVNEVTNRQGEKAKGSVTVTFNIERENEDLVSVTPSIKSTLPRKVLSGSIYFFGEQGSLHNRDPFQTDIEDVVDFKQAKTETGD